MYEDFKTFLLKRNEYTDYINSDIVNNISDDIINKLVYETLYDINHNILFKYCESIEEDSPYIDNNDPNISQAEKDANDTAIENSLKDISEKTIICAKFLGPDRMAQIFNTYNRHIANLSSEYGKISNPLDPSSNNNRITVYKNALKQCYQEIKDIINSTDPTGRHDIVLNRKSTNKLAITTTNNEIVSEGVKDVWNWIVTGLRNLWGKITGLFSKWKHGKDRGKKADSSVLSGFYGNDYRNVKPEDSDSKKASNGVTWKFKLDSHDKNIILLGGKDFDNFDLTDLNDHGKTSYYDNIVKAWTSIALFYGPKAVSDMIKIAQ